MYRAPAGGRLAPSERTGRAQMTDAEPRALKSAGFQGEIVCPGDPSYDDLRVPFNAMIDRRPGLIARCRGAADVSAAVGFARDLRLSLSVHGGGHAPPGYAVCEDGVMIDLRPMKRAEVDSEARTCHAEAGLTWGELDAATQEHGLAVTGGRMRTTGIAGFTLGGGSGWLERKHGYAVDNLLSVEIVTADGQTLTASKSENPQLFWGVRGGGGNFGVVTRFEYRLHPVGPIVLGGMLMYPAPMAPDVLANFREVMVDAPDELGAGVGLVTAPHAEFVPEPVRGQLVCGVIAMYAGPIEDGEQALRALREFGPPAMDMVEPMPYLAIQQFFDATNPRGMRNYMTAEYLSGLPDEAIEVMCRYHRSVPAPLTEIVLLPGGGVLDRIPENETAFRQRRAPFNVLIASMWPDAAVDEENIAWTREFRAALQPFAAGSAYLNFIGDEGTDRVAAAFGPDRYRRLQALKDRYDPENLFNLNQNIKPSGALATAAAAGQA
jgi:FAD/FMN-containing dehydrogenase